MVARDENGRVLVSAVVLHDGIPSAFTTEAGARHQSICLGFDRGWSKVEIESDALSIIKKCKSEKIDKSRISAFIFNIQRLKGSFQSLKFTKTPRSTNKLAHVCATVSLKKNEPFYLDNNIPSFARIWYDKELPVESD